MKYITNARMNSLVGIREDSSVEIYPNVYINIDYAYIIKEAGVLEYYNQKFDVEVGDLVLKLYGREQDDSYKREIVVIPAEAAKAWVENIMYTVEKENI